MKTLTDVLGRFGDRLSLAARREISNTSPVPLARRAVGWRMPGQGRGDYIRQMETYGTDAVIYPIINRLFTAVGEADWGAWTKAPREEDRKPIDSHPALDLITNPVPGLMNGTELAEAGQQHSDLTGETNIIVGRTAGIAFPTDLWPCRPDRLEPVPHENGYLQGWLYTGPEGQQVPLENTELLRHRMPNPLDMYRGMGPIQALLLDLDSQRYGREWQAQFFQNSARPGGVIEVDRRLSDDEFDEMTLRWREQHQGISKAHRVAIIEHGAKWVETSLSMRDMQFAELDVVNRDKTMVAFGFPKPLLGIVEDVNRANAEAGEYVFARWLVQPRLKRWRSMWNLGLLPLYGDRLAKTTMLDFVSPIPADSEAAMKELEVKSTALLALAGTGPFDADRVLEMLDWPDLGYTEPPPPTIVAPPGAPVPPGGKGGEEEKPKPKKPVEDTHPGRVQMAMRWEVIGEDDDNACDECKDNHGKLYRNRADAYADYPGGKGYIKCVGAQYGNNCRCVVRKRRQR